MPAPPIDHAANLRFVLPEVIARNIGLMTAVKDALKRRDNAVSARRDMRFLKELNELLAPLMRAKKFPAYTPDVLVERAAGRLEQVERILGMRFEGKRYLDIGCGHGENIIEACKRRATLSCGLDMDVARRNFWRKSVPNTFGMEYILDDLHTHDFGDKAFDVITSYNSFEHFDDPARVLARCTEITVPGGLMYLQFNPIFRSPMGSHIYRKMNVPYIQNLFDDDLVADMVFGDAEQNPYKGLNRLHLADFHSILINAEGWDPVYYDFTTCYDYAWLVVAMREEMNSFSDDDLYVSGVTAVLHRAD